METMVKNGEKFERDKASGAIGEGQGTKAGTAYRMTEGSIVYVPEDKWESLMDKDAVLNTLNRIMELELAGVVRYTHYALNIKLAQHAPKSCA